MKNRCLTAPVIGSLMLKGWKLVFMGEDGSAVASLEKDEGSEAPARDEPE